MRAEAGPAASAIAPAWPVDALEVGRIAGAWGVKGWFKVAPYASEALALQAAKSWHLRWCDERALRPTAAATALERTLAIVSCRPHGDIIVANARGIDDRAGAEALRGASVHIARADFPAVGSDEFYWADLLGLDVVNREGQRFGTVSVLLDTGPHSVLRVVASASAEERLIPFVAAYVDSVDLARRCIVVDWQPDF
ncbi:MAG: ribosome maturation factor RimM [Pseudomonadota bacterium]|nr:ribosome maturation factor RimM [Pseudomonadota bacterium]